MGLDFLAPLCLFGYNKKGKKMSLNNEVRLIGNLVRDPETFDTKKGKFAKVRIAVNTRRGDIEDTLYIDVKLFGNVYRDIETNNLTKGDRIVTYGRLVVEEYSDKEGNKKREAAIYANSVMKIAKREMIESNF